METHSPISVTSDGAAAFVDILKSMILHTQPRPRARRPTKQQPLPQCLTVSALTRPPERAVLASEHTAPRSALPQPGQYCIELALGRLEYKYIILIQNLNVTSANARGPQACLGR
jgi:hypothetical protein